MLGASGSRVSAFGVSGFGVERFRVLVFRVSEYCIADSSMHNRWYPRTGSAELYLLTGKRITAGSQKRACQASWNRDRGLFGCWRLPHRRAEGVV